ncbi:hypothetical protein KPSA3_05920 [Pseudomonas syringae pv. actinidiae]|uniref:Uncharacterized protein n=1 Tax=Pseudomonas syringae pv. actinidiae TaxID=103796 RepID=A0AAN4Q9G0_PSESF|nr:hypothetical protein KPSA3_05920 [Pseudomonas syringae pv. actinidiae]
MTDNQPLATSLLATQTQTTDQGAVTANVLTFQVIQQLAALVYHTDQTTTGVVVLTVGLEVALQFVDVGGQQCNLHFWRTSITNSLLVVGYDLSFFFNAECHVGNPYFREALPGKRFQQAEDKTSY